MANDFTEDDIKYKIPAHVVFETLNILQDRIAALELKVDQMHLLNADEHKRLHELAIVAFNS